MDVSSPVFFTEGGLDDIEETPPSAPPKKRLKARKLAVNDSSSASAPISEEGVTSFFGVGEGKEQKEREKEKGGVGGEERQEEEAEGEKDKGEVGKEKEKGEVGGGEKKWEVGGKENCEKERGEVAEGNEEEKGEGGERMEEEEEAEKGEGGGKGGVGEEEEEKEEKGKGGEEEEKKEAEKEEEEEEEEEEQEEPAGTNFLDGSLTLTGTPMPAYAPVTEREQEQRQRDDTSAAAKVPTPVLPTPLSAELTGAAVDGTGGVVVATETMVTTHAPPPVPANDGHRRHRSRCFPSASKSPRESASALERRAHLIARLHPRVDGVGEALEPPLGGGAVEGLPSSWLASGDGAPATASATTGATTAIVAAAAVALARSNSTQAAEKAEGRKFGKAKKKRGGEEEEEDGEGSGEGGGKGVERDSRSDNALCDQNVGVAGLGGTDHRIAAPPEEKHRVHRAKSRKGTGRTASERLSKGKGVVKDMEASSRGPAERSGERAVDPPAGRGREPELASESVPRVKGVARDAEVSSHGQTGRSNEERGRAPEVASESVRQDNGVARDVEVLPRGQAGRSNEGDPPARQVSASELAALVRWNAVSRTQATKRLYAPPSSMIISPYAEPEGVLRRRPHSMLFFSCFAVEFCSPWVPFPNASESSLSAVYGRRSLRYGCRFLAATF